MEQHVASSYPSNLQSLKEQDIHISHDDSKATELRCLRVGYYCHRNIPVSINRFDVFPGKTQRGLQDECIYPASLLTVHRLLVMCSALGLCTRRKLMFAINHLVLNLITLVLIKAHNESKSIQS